MAGGYMESQNYFSGKGGTQIFYRTWLTESPSGLVIIAHGVGEHCQRYGNLINYLDGRGVSFYALDHRGHGHSAGKRGHVDSFADYRYDLNILIQKARQDHPGLPVILLGHSMGGVIALGYALHYPASLNGLIISSAGLIPAFQVPRWKTAMAGILSTIMPGLAMSSGLDAGHLSHDQTVVNSYQADPLVHDRVTARWYTEFTEAGEECLRRAHELTMPLLIIHGQGDKIVDWRGSETVMNTASSADKEFHLFDGLFHETMNEAAEQRIQVLECIGSWIDRILKY